MNSICILSDGSVFYESIDPRGNITGCGGYAMQIHYHDTSEPSQTIKVAASTHTHINVMEMYAMHDAFAWINNESNNAKMQNADVINIISDSQNTLKYQMMMY